MDLRNSCMPETGGWQQAGEAPGGRVGRLSPNSPGRVHSLCWRTVLLFTDSPGRGGPLPSHLVTGLGLAGW